jgi:hypothetical protein
MRQQGRDRSPDRPKVQYTTKAVGSLFETAGIIFSAFRFSSFNLLSTKTSTRHELGYDSLADGRIRLSHAGARAAAT